VLRLLGFDQTGNALGLTGVGLMAATTAAGMSLSVA